MSLDNISFLVSLPNIVESDFFEKLLNESQISNATIDCWDRTLLYPSDRGCCEYLDLFWDIYLAKASLKDPCINKNEKYNYSLKNRRN